MGPAPVGDDVGDDTSPPVQEIPAEHRPQALACPSNSTGGVACNDSAECNGDTPGALPNNCLHGQCGPDQCLDDGDCGSNEVCSCLTQGSGGYPGPQVGAGNVCVAALCHVDADCGAEGYCSPSSSADCTNLGGVTGYYCHRPGDACVNDSDCRGLSCVYDTTLGRWACQEAVICAG